jgi:hypothetical protein
VNPPLEPNQLAAVKLQVRNVGKTVALEESTRYRIEVVKSDDPPWFVLNKTPTGQDIVFDFPTDNNPDFPAVFSGGRASFKADEIDELRSGKSYMAVFGQTT